MLHEDLRLFISTDAYTLIGESDKGEALHIDRRTGHYSLLPSANPPTKFDKSLPVYGLFGIVSLLKSDYLVVITKRTKVADILSTALYSATNFSVFPIDRSSTVSLLGHPDEAYLLGLLKSHLFSAPFYFTYGGYNVTNRLQEQIKQGPSTAGKALWETCDDRFFWNRHLQRPLIDATTRSPDQDFSRFILPVMFGFLEIKSTSINGRPLIFGLISRRNRFRAGTRYFSRGIDRDGNVSNFNETEQILLLDSVNTTGGAAGEKGGPGPVGGVKGEIRFSYVQTRGSVPVYWAEINNLRYKPDLKIMDLSTTAESLTRHFDQQVSLYGSQYLVNLVNKGGYEKPVKEAYEKVVNQLGNDKVHYTYFDFHHECKGLRFDRVSVLLEGLDRELVEQGYFFQDITSSPSKAQQTQSSVVRTNCMDCLDRTNVVQSALGKWVLNNQLRQVGVLSVKESIDEHKEFLNLFRNVWADNADVVSRAYSGTGALKTDYTRTGKRSKEGALQDGVNSVVRYVKNNFLDGPRQDAYDLVTGSWVPRKGQENSWRDDRDLLTRAAPYVMLIAVLVLTLASLAPSLVGETLASRKVTLLCGILIAATFIHITNNGVDYVAWPKLVTLDDVLSYSGKGFESGRRGRPVRRAGAKGGKTSKSGRKESSVLPMLSSTNTSKMD